ncbi:MAG: hypothetical protein JO022_22275 [Acidobacteriaceae bacterium]|nr:hypothetical protein [Acidobacteriaceae bacterium]
MADETRFQRAIRDTPGLREDKRRRAIQSVVGAACAVLLLLIFASPNDATAQALGYIGAILGGVLIINGLEFVWHYLEAPYALLREEVAALRADVHELPAAEEEASGGGQIRGPWIGDMTRRAVVLMCIQRGETILSQQTIPLGTARKWTEETVSILNSKVGNVAGENFLASGVGANSARDRIERGLSFLRGLQNNLPSGER